ncbi:hypothetical protein FisN_1Lh333 [Fistulifera solaris]|uniref:WRKY19-like zinc finger domain-containing protein n=1 Tax=Fistulifera solaris TaxID=1519565 RepID=A0A1Z5K425_FISSO|nr:hypothetical protein FisN_1Lh333 [Fistulifera solaris]|eukprot:GAX21000.1 hypothetical protein FisN_1Lh333 [Fistulifera solaris]
MDPERVRAYLQAACAGLGFDVGEVWWTSSENGSSTVAAIEDQDSALARSQGRRQLRFVQLYTSKNFESHRAELINPPDHSWNDKNDSEAEVSEHVLSPRLVNAISSTAQVVWATTKKQEGLTGRSDVVLQTAVGMPVAVDANGNMCVVVMFSPNNIQSTEDSLDFLRSLSQSAATTSIPCLLPAFDPVQTGMRQIGPSTVNQQAVVALGRNAGQNLLGDGVNARFVSITDIDRRSGAVSRYEPDLSYDHDLQSAPKDDFGIPMLPSFAEIGGTVADESIDAFDEATYGVWTTIMDKPTTNIAEDTEYTSIFDISDRDTQQRDSGYIGDDISLLQPSRIQRLEEFCHAFLGMSVFDLAEVWVPDSNHGDSLSLCMSATCTETNELLNEFRKCSANKLIKHWTGAVGRAFASGNPVWTANPNVFADPMRADAFVFSKIQTVLAVPVFAGKRKTPSCVVVCYSLVKSASVPFVLKFVQQALRLLWDGLDKVEPHESVDKTIWNGVAPADLGEMAADIEMQHHFMSKKRPHNSIATFERQFEANDDQNYPLTVQMKILGFTEEDLNPNPINVTVHEHVSDALLSIRSAVPFEHMYTNVEGTKRAHVSNRVPAPLSQPNRLPSKVVSAVESLPGKRSPQVNRQDFSAMNANTYQRSASLSTATQSLGSEQSQDFESGPLVYPQVNNLALSSQYCSPVMIPEYSAKMCRIQGCSEVAVPRRPHCMKHSGTRLCEHEGCSKCAQGSTRFCIAHGGGRRCTFQGCDKGARDKFFCAAHGGGKRCIHDGCSKSAVGGSKLCTAHGGGRRCSVEGCDKSAQSSTEFCVKHGGGKKCAQADCDKVARGRTSFCAAHGGGVRCKLEGCNRVAIGKRQLCRLHGGGASRKSESKQTHIFSQHNLQTTDSYSTGLHHRPVQESNLIQGLERSFDFLESV